MACSDGTVRIADPLTGRAKGTIQVFKPSGTATSTKPVAYVNSIRYDEESARIYMGSSNGSIQIYDHVGQWLGKAESAGRRIRALAVGQGNFFSASQPSTSISAHDPRTGARVGELPGHSATVRALSVTGDSKQDLWSVSEGEARLWRCDVSKSASSMMTVVKHKIPHVSQAVYVPFANPKQMWLGAPGSSFTIVHAESGEVLHRQEAKSAPETRYWGLSSTVASSVDSITQSVWSVSSSRRLTQWRVASTAHTIPLVDVGTPKYSIKLDGGGGAPSALLSSGDPRIASHVKNPNIIYVGTAQPGALLAYDARKLESQRIAMSPLVRADDGAREVGLPAAYVPSPTLSAASSVPDVLNESRFALDDDVTDSPTHGSLSQAEVQALELELGQSAVNGAPVGQRKDLALSTLTSVSEAPNDFSTPISSMRPAWLQFERTDAGRKPIRSAETDPSVALSLEDLDPNTSHVPHEQNATAVEGFVDDDDVDLGEFALDPVDFGPPLESKTINEVKVASDANEITSRRPVTLPQLTLDETINSTVDSDQIEDGFQRYPTLGSESVFLQVPSVEAAVEPKGVESTYHEAVPQDSLALLHTPQKSQLAGAAQAQQVVTLKPLGHHTSAAKVVSSRPSGIPTPKTPGQPLASKDRENVLKRATPGRLSPARSHSPAANTQSKRSPSPMASLRPAGSSTPRDSRSVPPTPPRQRTSTHRTSGIPTTPSTRRTSSGSTDSARRPEESPSSASRTGPTQATPPTAPLQPTDSLRRLGELSHDLPLAHLTSEELAGVFFGLSAGIDTLIVKTETLNEKLRCAEASREQERRQAEEAMRKLRNEMQDAVMSALRRGRLEGERKAKSELYPMIEAEAKRKASRMVAEQEFYRGTAGAGEPSGPDYYSFAQSGDPRSKPRRDSVAELDYFAEDDSEALRLARADIAAAAAEAELRSSLLRRKADPTGTGSVADTSQRTDLEKSVFESDASQDDPLELSVAQKKIADLQRELSLALDALANANASQQDSTQVSEELLQAKLDLAEARSKLATADERARVAEASVKLLESELETERQANAELRRLCTDVEQGQEKLRSAEAQIAALRAQLEKETSRAAGLASLHAQLFTDFRNEFPDQSFDTSSADTMAKVKQMLNAMRSELEEARVALDEARRGEREAKRGESHTLLELEDFRLENDHLKRAIQSLRARENELEDKLVDAERALVQLRRELAVTQAELETEQQATKRLVQSRNELKTEELERLLRDSQGHQTLRSAIENAYKQIQEYVEAQERLSNLLRETKVASAAHLAAREQAELENVRLRAKLQAMQRSQSHPGDGPGWENADRLDLTLDVDVADVASEPLLESLSIEELRVRVSQLEREARLLREANARLEIELKQAKDMKSAADEQVEHLTQQLDMLKHALLPSELPLGDSHLPVTTTDLLSQTKNQQIQDLESELRMAMERLSRDRSQFEAEKAKYFNTYISESVPMQIPSWADIDVAKAMAKLPALSRVAVVYACQSDMYHPPVGSQTTLEPHIQLAKDALGELERIIQSKMQDFPLLDKQLDYTQTSAEDLGAKLQQLFAEKSKVDSTLKEREDEIARLKIRIVELERASAQSHASMGGSDSGSVFAKELADNYESNVSSHLQFSPLSSRGSNASASQYQSFSEGAPLTAVDVRRILEQDPVHVSIHVGSPFKFDSDEDAEGEDPVNEGCVKSTDAKDLIPKHVRSASEIADVSDLRPRQNASAAGHFETPPRIEQASIVPDVRLQHLKETLQDKETEITRLSEKLRASELMVEDLAHQFASIKSKFEESHRTWAATDQERASEVSHLKQLLEQANDSESMLKLELAQAQFAHGKLRDELGQTQASLEEARSDVERLQMQLIEAKNAKSQEVEEMAKLLREMSDELARRPSPEGYEKDLADARSQLIDTQVQLTDLQREHESTLDLLRTITDKKVELERRLSDASGLYEQLEEEENLLNGLKELVSIRDAELREVRRELLQAKEELKTATVTIAQLEPLQKELDAKLGEIDQLRSEVILKQGQIDSVKHDLSVKLGELDGARVELANAQATILHLQHQLECNVENQQTGDVVKQLQDKIKELESEIVEAARRADLAAARADAAEAQVLDLQQTLQQHLRGLPPYSSSAVRTGQVEMVEDPNELEFHPFAAGSSVKLVSHITDLSGDQSMQVSEEYSAEHSIRSADSPARQTNNRSLASQSAESFGTGAPISIDNVDIEGAEVRIPQAPMDRLFNAIPQDSSVVYVETLDDRVTTPVKTSVQAHRPSTETTETAHQITSTTLSDDMTSEEMYERILRLEAELRLSQDTQEQLRSDAETACLIAKELERECAELRQKLDELEVHDPSQYETSATREHLQEELSNLRQEVLQLRLQEEGLRLSLDAASEKLHAVENQHTEEKRALLRQIADADAAVQYAETTNDDLKSQVGRLTHELDAAKAELMMTQAKLEEKVNECEKLRVELASRNATTNPSETEEQLRALQAALANTQEQLELTQKHAAAQALEMRKLVREKEELDEQLSRSTARTQSSKSPNDYDRFDELDAAIASLESILVKERRQAATEAEDLNDVIRRKEALLSQHAADLERLRAELAQATLAQEAETARLIAAIAEQDARAEQSATTAREAEARVRELEAAVAKWEEVASTAQAAAAAAKESAEQWERWGQEHAALLQNYEARMQQLAEKEYALEQQQHSLQQKLADVEQREQSMEVTVAERKQRQVTQALLAAEEAERLAKEEIARRVAVEATLAEEMDTRLQLAKECDTLRQALAEAQRQVSSEASRLQATENALDLAKMQIQALKESLAGKSEEVARLEQKERDMARAYEERLAKLQSMRLQLSGELESLSVKKFTEQIGKDADMARLQEQKELVEAQLVVAREQLRLAEARGAELERELDTELGGLLRHSKDPVEMLEHRPESSGNRGQLLATSNMGRSRSAATNATGSASTTQVLASEVDDELAELFSLVRIPALDLGFTEQDQLDQVPHLGVASAKCDDGTSQKHSALMLEDLDESRRDAFDDDSQESLQHNSDNPESETRVAGETQTHEQSRCTDAPQELGALERHSTPTPRPEIEAAVRALATSEQARLEHVASVQSLQREVERLSQQLTQRTREVKLLQQRLQESETALERSNRIANENAISERNARSAHEAALVDLARSECVVDQLRSQLADPLRLPELHLPPELLKSLNNSEGTASLSNSETGPIITVLLAREEQLRARIQAEQSKREALAVDLAATSARESLLHEQLQRSQAERDRLEQELKQCQADLAKEREEVLVTTAEIGAEMDKVNALAAQVRHLRANLDVANGVIRTFNQTLGVNLPEIHSEVSEETQNRYLERIASGDGVETVENSCGLAESGSMAPVDNEQQPPSEHDPPQQLPHAGLNTSQSRRIPEPMKIQTLTLEEDVFEVDLIRRELTPAGGFTHQGFFSMAQDGTGASPASVALGATPGSLPLHPTGARPPLPTLRRSGSRSNSGTPVSFDRQPTLASAQAVAETRALERQLHAAQEALRLKETNCMRLNAELAQAEARVRTLTEQLAGKDAAFNELNATHKQLLNDYNEEREARVRLSSELLRLQERLEAHPQVLNEIGLSKDELSAPTPDPNDNYHLVLELKQAREQIVQLERTNAELLTEIKRNVAESRAHLRGLAAMEKGIAQIDRRPYQLLQPLERSSYPAESKTAPNEILMSIDSAIKFLGEQGEHEMSSQRPPTAELETSLRALVLQTLRMARTAVTVLIEVGQTAGTLLEKELERVENLRRFEAQKSATDVDLMTSADSSPVTHEQGVRHDPNYIPLPADLTSEDAVEAWMEGLKMRLIEGLVEAGLIQLEIVPAEE